MIDQIQEPTKYTTPPITLVITTYELAKIEPITPEENPYEWLATVTHIFHADNVQRAYQIMDAHKQTDSFFKASFEGRFPWKGGEIILRNSKPQIITGI